MNDYKEILNKARLYRKLEHSPLVLSVYDAMVDAIEQLVRERDAAIKDLFEEADSRLNTCLYCKKDADCVLDCDNALWEWRGVQE